MLFPCSTYHKARISQQFSDIEEGDLDAAISYLRSFCTQATCGRDTSTFRPCGFTSAVPFTICVGTFDHGVSLLKTERRCSTATDEQGDEKITMAHFYERQKL